MKRVSLYLLALVLILVITAAMSSCKSTNTPAVVPTTAVTTTSAAPQPSTTAAAPKTLKIGVVCWSGFAIGLDLVRVLDVMAEVDNKNGGINIGGEKYKVELIKYDSSNSQATEVSAVNRLIYEDKVKYIIADENFASAWLPTAEKEKVIAMGGPPVTFNLIPDYHYSFNPTFGLSTSYVFAGWFCKNYPDLTKKMVIAYPDNQMGHMISMMNDGLWKAFGVTVSNEFYPATSTDLSALGTKVKSSNPTTFITGGGGLSLDCQAIKAVYNAGYRGQMFTVSAMTAVNMHELLSNAEMEGFIDGAWPVEFDPALTQESRNFREGWIAKYGKWDGPELLGAGNYACLKTALMKAGTLDTEKLAALISNGMEYDGPTGAGKMVSRPDNPRTVDSITTAYVKQIKGGQPVLLASIGIEEGMQYREMGLKSLPPFPPK
jgi:branched-chain amino acid transport system substrate-binding protein